MPCHPLPRLLAAVAAGLALAFPARAEEPCHGAAPAAAPPLAASRVEALVIPDVVLNDQDGRAVRVRDLIAGHRVAMNFIFTTCTTICPPQGATFAKLQKRLAEGPPLAAVQLISVSIDPAVDTPARLKAWRDKLAGSAPGGGPSWTLLTGGKPQVDALLKALQVFTPDKGSHSPVALVGDGASGRWQRLYGLPSPAELVEALGAFDATVVATQEVTR